MTPARFRFLILLEIACIVAATIAGTLFSDDAFSLRLRSAYDAEPTALAALPPWLLLSIMAALGVAITASTIGLWQFKRWARTLTLWLAVLMLPFALLAGPMLEAPVEGLFSELSSLLFGAIMALAYFSPVSARFEAGAKI